MCQTFHLHRRATRLPAVHGGAGHGPRLVPRRARGGAAVHWACSIGETNTHLIQLGHFLPLVKHYVEGNVPALDFLTRQYESFHPIGVRPPAIPASW